VGRVAASQFEVAEAKVSKIVAAMEDVLAVYKRTRDRDTSAVLCVVALPSGEILGALNPLGRHVG
jgi:hypothetical protein